MIAILGLFLKGIFSGILTFLKWCVENWKIVLPILVIGITVWYIWHLRGVVQKQELRHQQDVVIIQQWTDKFLELKGKYDAAVEEFKLTITKQNAKVDAIAKQAEKFKRQAEIANRENTQIKKAAEERIQAILNAERPKTADESIRYLINHASELSNWGDNNVSEKPSN